MGLTGFRDIMDTCEKQNISSKNIKAFSIGYYFKISLNNFTERNLTKFIPKGNICFVAKCGTFNKYLCSLKMSLWTGRLIL